jgi:hypothetical protein
MSGTRLTREVVIRRGIDSFQKKSENVRGRVWGTSGRTSDGEKKHKGGKMGTYTVPGRTDSDMQRWRG